MERRFVNLLAGVVCAACVCLWGIGSPAPAKAETEDTPPLASLDSLDSSRPPAGVKAVTDPFDGPARPRGGPLLLDPKVFRTRPIDMRAWFPQERAALASAAMRTGFPRLGADYVVLAPSAKGYNCIAWTVEITDRWVWPGEKVSSFDRLYAQVGYKRLKTADYRLTRGYDKIALYGKVADRQVSCTHGAWQTADGKWTSKLGQMALIAHETPEALTGPGYGKPLFVYIRKKPSASPPPDKR